ncbi:MAG: glycosyltransferase [Deltaproteobacteria bacterium]|nr:glycosyltransferase [Deltaproteobacteria bacterium]
MPPQISLILPIYRAASFLSESLKLLHSSLSQELDSWELILVVDGSPDHSLEICREFVSKERPYKVRILEHERNKGKGAAIRHGMLAARGQFRIFTDCDLSFTITEVKKILLALKQGSDLAIASRVKKESSYSTEVQKLTSLRIRHFYGRTFNRLTRQIVPIGFEDTQAGLKGFSGPAAEFLFSNLRLNGFSFDVELLYLAQQTGLKIAEIPVHFSFRDGSTLNYLVDGFQMFIDLFRIRYWTHRRKYVKTALSYGKEVGDQCG